MPVPGRRGWGRRARVTWLYPFLPWIKVAHVFAIVAWMAGLLYLPRLFAYHAAAQPGTDQSETFKIMERRLLRGIMNPAMVLAWGAGLILVWASNYWLQPWFLVKAGAVIAVTVIHHLYAAWRKDFERDGNSRSPAFYKLWNEVPAVLLIVILIMVIVKPF
jgi:putative membrane protein